MCKRAGILLFCLCCLLRGAFAQDSSASASVGTAGTDTIMKGSPAGADSALTDSAVGAVTDSVAAQDTAAAAMAVPDIWYTLRKDVTDTGSAQVRVFRKVPPSTVAVLRKDDDFWYVSVGPDRKVPKKVAKATKPFNPFNISKWFVFLIYSLIAGLLVAAIVFLLQSGSGEPWFRLSKRKTPAGGETAEADSPPDLHQAFDAAVAKGDYNAAVRYLFLITLQRLYARNCLKPGRDKTNSEYLREFRGNALYPDFARLVLHYEYTFYGGFALEQALFGEIRKQYEQFQNRLDAL